jgi:hypothetical protein
MICKDNIEKLSPVVKPYTVIQTIFTLTPKYLQISLAAPMDFALRRYSTVEQCFGPRPATSTGEG